MRADRHLYLDRSRTRLVGETDPAVAWMLAGKGQEIDPADVKRLDLVVWGDGRVMQGPEPILAPEPEPAAVVSPAPLEDVVSPAGAMPEPIMPPQVRRSRRRK